MSEPLAPKNAKAFAILGAKAYADCFMLSLETIKATGPNGQHRQEDVDQVVAARSGALEWAQTVAAAKKTKRPASPQAPRTRQASAPAPDSVTRSASDINAQVYADPTLHKAMWAMGVRDMEPPKGRGIVSYPDFSPAWDPKPVLVDNGDGTGQWVTPLADYSQSAGLFDAKEIHKPGSTWDEQ